jgi:hypothetical protein
MSYQIANHIVQIWAEDFIWIKAASTNTPSYGRDDRTECKSGLLGNGRTTLAKGREICSLLGWFTEMIGTETNKVTRVGQASHRDRAGSTDLRLPGCCDSLTSCC